MRVADTGPGNWPPRGPARVLLVFDRPTLRDVIALALKHGVYSTRSAATSDEAAELLTVWRPHLVLFDADLDGARVMAQLRRSAAHIPAITLACGGNLKTKLAAFDWGVDDVLLVPFAQEELLARVTAVIRRCYSDAVTFTPMVKAGELEIDILNRTVRAGTAELRLTSLEQSLLYLLAANAGRTVTRDEILDTLWGADYVAESNVVDRQVRNLRHRLRDDWRQPRFIATVPGAGYQFLPTVTKPAQEA